MPGRVSTERVFSLAALEGLKLIWKYSALQPDLELPELQVLIEKVDADGASVDLEASAYLGTLLEPDCPRDGVSYYQVCIKAVLIKHQPIWAKSMRTGRKRFVSSLDQNDQDIFAAAGLMEDPPSTEVVSWWDDVVGHSRLLTDVQKMAQARQAELLTIEHERQRMAELGIVREPEWPGLDDNFAGYDVLSYDLAGNRLVARMIEVKSTVASPLRFIVSRNEWTQAEEIGESYVFHIWDMTRDPPTLFIRTVEEVAPHIPTNNEDGVWSSAAIPLGA